MMKEELLHIKLTLNLPFAILSFIIAYWLKVKWR